MAKEVSSGGKRAAVGELADDGIPAQSSEHFNAAAHIL